MFPAKNVFVQEDRQTGTQAGRLTGRQVDLYVIIIYVTSKRVCIT